MRKLAVLMAAMLSVGLSGCASRYADVPIPTRFANEDQLKLQAARHWQLIADHFAGRLATELEGKLNGRAVYVPQPGGEQQFVEGFRELLISALVAKGVPVALSARGALVADVDYHYYKFTPDRAPNARQYGQLTVLTAGLWALGGVVSANIAHAAGVDAGIKTLTTVASLEGASFLSNEALRGGRLASGDVPRSEILLTVTVGDANRIVARQSNIYYSVDADIDLYWKRSSTSRSVSVVGDCGGREAKCAR